MRRLSFVVRIGRTKLKLLAFVGLVKRAEPEPGAQPEWEAARYGEAEPRLTSGGEAVSKITSSIRK
jgi:hypothetical protein